MTKNLLSIHSFTLKKTVKKTKILYDSFYVRLVYMVKNMRPSGLSQKAKPLLPPILLFLILALIMSLIWLHEREQSRLELRELTHVMSQQVAIRLENWINAREAISKLLAKLWPTDYADNPTKFKRYAQNILNNYPGFLAINWIDSTWTIRIVNPDDPNRTALGKNLHKHPFPTVQQTLEKAMATGKMATTPPIHLLQGGSGIVSYIPVYASQKHLLGFINVVFRIDSLIHYCLNDAYVNTHFDYIIYSNGNRPIFWKGNIPRNFVDAASYKASAPAKIIDQKWLVTLFPTPQFIHEKITTANNRNFLFNLLFSFTIAFLIWILLLRNRRLKQSEDHFRTLFDSASTWIHILNPDGTILNVNRAFLNATSRTKNSVLGKNFADFLSADSKALFKTILASLNENRQFQAELRFQTDSGALRHLDCFGAVVHDKNNKPQFIILHEIDITQRKYYQNKLNESEEKYRALSEQSSIGVYLIRNRKLIYTNPKFAQIFGYDSPKEIMNSKSLDDFIKKDEKEKVDRALRELLRGHDNEMHLEITGKKKDGSPVHLEAFGHRIVVNNRPAILGTFIDISERVKHLETIRQLSKAVEQSPVATIISDMNGIIEYVNPAFSKITGFKAHEVMGQSYKIHQGKDIDETIYQDIRRTVIEGKVWSGEFKSHKKDGEQFWARCVISPLKDKSGKIMHLLTSMEDITEQKQLENELVQKQKMEAIGRLAGGIAHDFNNLLTVINGYSQLILHTLPRENALYPKIEQIFQAGERAKNLTSQLLAFSRKQIRQPSPINLSLLVQDIEKMLTRLIGEDVQITCSLQNDLWTIASDKNQIEQIILNLAVNARQAMPDGGKLTISTENIFTNEALIKQYPEIKPGKYVRLSIEDTGIGMDEETQKHIFEPFFTTKPMGQGTGLGLATVYGIVKQNEGYIYVNSAPTKGTKFCIYFPAIEKKAQNDIQEAISETKLKGDETIFLVEDDPSVRELTLRALNYFGYKVIVSKNGEEALKRFNQNNIHVDLLITDVIMPGIGGKKLVDLLHQHHPDLKVLFMSGYSEDQISRKGILNGSINFIQKPFAPIELVKQLRRILDR